MPQAIRGRGIGLALAGERWNAGSGLGGAKEQPAPPAEPGL